MYNIYVSRTITTFLSKVGKYFVSLIRVVLPKAVTLKNDS
jgi:hypothetical protein